MGNHYFRFKQFTVWQQRCAMKVNTLGCILGVCARHPNPVRVLDIGTGTGVVALMLAQRFPMSMIDALEIDAEAAAQAGENAAASPWSRRISVQHTDARRFESEAGYDLIVSNPPFFEDHQTTGDPRVDLARHDAGLRPADLVKLVARQLHGDGLFYAVLPQRPMDRVNDLAGQAGLRPVYDLEVRNFDHSPVLAVVRGFGFTAAPTERAHLTIWDAPGQPSLPFRKMMSAFYLNF